MPTFHLLVHEIDLLQSLYISCIASLELLIGCDLDTIFAFTEGVRVLHSLMACKYGCNQKLVLNKISSSRLPLVNSVLSLHIHVHSIVRTFLKQCSVPGLKLCRGCILSYIWTLLTSWSDPWCDLLHFSHGIHLKTETTDTSLKRLINTQSSLLLSAFGLRRKNVACLGSQLQWP